MTADLILDPASAIAVSRCLLARVGTPVAVTNDHPRPCAWEDYTRADLARMLDDFNAEAGYTDRHEPAGRFVHLDVQRFHCLPKPEQQRRIAAAQYPTEAPR